MRPPSVYANPSCPADDPCDLLRALHGPHRVACRLVMILLSQQGLAASQIAGLLGYDPSTVRRWIHCDQRHGTAGLADRVGASNSVTHATCAYSWTSPPSRSRRTTLPAGRKPTC
jgi:hypothetical protein